MLDPEAIHKFDEAQSTLGEVLPTLLWNLYRKFIEVGFSEEQAFDLIKTYLIVTLGQSCDG